MAGALARPGLAELSVENYEQLNFLDIHSRVVEPGTGDAR